MFSDWGEYALEIIEFTLSDGVLRDENNKNISISDPCKRFDLELNSFLDSWLYERARDICDDDFYINNDLGIAFVDLQGKRLALQIEKLLPKNYIVSYKNINPQNYYRLTAKNWLPKTKEQLKNLINNEKIRLDTIDTQFITDMSELFKGGVRKDFSGIEDWDVSHVENMEAMFKGCKGFNHYLHPWKVDKVRNMKEMFAGCESFDNWLFSFDSKK